MATYVTNLVQLIGLGIAIDYSLLMIYRFREELRRDGTVEDAVLRTMATAGRAVVFSGLTVAIGLSLLLFMPLPFIRSIGVGGFRSRTRSGDGCTCRSRACPAARTSSRGCGRGSPAPSCAVRRATSLSVPRSSSPPRSRSTRSS
jgi:hypothetical protein